MIISKSVIIVQNEIHIANHACRIDITILLRQVLSCASFVVALLFRFSSRFAIQAPTPTLHTTTENLLLKAIKNQKNLVIYSSIDCFARSRPLIPASSFLLCASSAAAPNETEVISGNKI